MVNIKRETAINCKVIDLLEGEFIKTEGWNPSYFSTGFGNVSRANIIGVVVSKEGNDLFIDDGSGKILLKNFDNKINDFNLGDIILVIGRPRIYNNQKYLVPEILKKVYARWGVYQKLKIELLRKNIKKVDVQPKNIIKQEKNLINYFQKIIEFIKDLDEGLGADIDLVIERSNINNASNYIKKLIEEGEIFEVKPGKLKIL